MEIEATQAMPLSDFEDEDDSAILDGEKRVVDIDLHLYYANIILINWCMNLAM